MIKVVVILVRFFIFLPTVLTMSSNDESLSSTYPPDIGCFAEGYWSPENFKAYNCSVTNSMVNFLNLSRPEITGQPFLSVYCLNPPADDDCPFGLCPNPDIAGPLVRFSSRSIHLFTRVVVTEC